MNTYDDVETNKTLRYLRFKLFGYGRGWTFWGALWDWIQIYLWLIVLIAIWVYLCIHFSIGITIKYR